MKKYRYVRYIYLVLYQILSIFQINIFSKTIFFTKILMQVSADFLSRNHKKISCKSKFWSQNRFTICKRISHILRIFDPKISRQLKEQFEALERKETPMLIQQSAHARCIQQKQSKSTSKPKNKKDKKGCKRAQTSKCIVKVKENDHDIERIV